VCLLVVVFATDGDAPLVVGANRDERLARPATAMAVLQPHAPRILGGRDIAAGGTWLAVNQHGLVAGLTNRPVPDGRDPTKRTRGELPLALARHRGADAAVAAFVETVRPADYNPAWLLVGDRRSLYSVEVAEAPRPVARRLDPGVHILENSPLGAPSLKVDHVARLLGPVPGAPGPDLLARLRRLLAQHSVPAPSPEDGRPLPTLAPCVHSEDYGTRSSTVIRVGPDPAVRPEVLAADGPPCTSPFVDATSLWAA